MESMDHSSKTLETAEDEQQQHQMFIRSPFATASISLSLPTIITSKPTLASKFQSLHQTHQPNILRIPSQASSLSNSISSQIQTLTQHRPKPFSSKSSMSTNPFHHPLPINPLRPSDPSNSAALHRTSIVWFRNDLRLHDNECLNAANNDSTSILPLFCFDPKSFKSSAPRSHTINASFLIKAVADLRDNLRSKGSDLIVRVGNPKTILIEIAKSIGAGAVYAHTEISKSETESELAIEAAMKDEGIEFKSFWGNTLVHLDDLPFGLESMPTSFDQFRWKVGSLKPRKTIAALEQIKGKPARGDVDAGEIPGLKDLGLGSSSICVVNGPFGGESEAQKKVKSVVAEFKAQVQQKSGKNGVESVFGANFLSKLNPWLATGCVSAKAVFEELKNNGNVDGGMEAITNELVWRDFFRFITKNCANVNRSNGPPLVAAGSLA